MSECGPAIQGIATEPDWEAGNISMYMWMRQDFLTYTVKTECIHMRETSQEDPNQSLVHPGAG